MATEVGKCLYDTEKECRCQKFFADYNNSQNCLLCHHHIGWHEQPVNNFTRLEINRYDDERIAYQMQQRSQRNNFGMVPPENSQFYEPFITPSEVQYSK